MCRRSYPFARKLADHVCHEIQCKVCDGWKSANHKCYMSAKVCKVNLGVGKLRFFDFESDPNQGHNHIPNYAAVWDGISYDDDGKPDMQIYHARGGNIIDQFVAGEFCEKNRGCTYVAHNAKAYDAQFIKECCSRKSIQIVYIPNGNKIMELKISGLSIRIIDSVNFIQARLAGFPGVFGLDGARKGDYPYAFNTRDNWDYEGIMPPLQLFLPHGEYGVQYEMGEELQKFSKKDVKRDDFLKLKKRRKDIIIWWREKVRVTGEKMFVDVFLHVCCSACIFRLARITNGIISRSSKLIVGMMWRFLLAVVWHSARFSWTKQLATNGQPKKEIRLFEVSLVY